MARMTPRALIRPATVPIARTLLGLIRHLPARDVQTVTIAGGIGVRLFRPDTGEVPGPALLWIHGGGYVIGTAAQEDMLCRRYAKQLGVTVAAVEYRLAPEHPYPTPVEDCYTALTWLAALPSVDPDRVAIGGVSGGGGLTAALAFVARDRGEVSVAAQMLLAPMLDDRSGSNPHPRESGYRMWDRRSNDFAWDAYLGAADRNVAVPARRTDLAGLPPTWIGVGTLDLFHDENLAYAKRLRDAGVPCETQVVPGAFHTFELIAPKTRVVTEFFHSQYAMLRPILSR